MYFNGRMNAFTQREIRVCYRDEKWNIIKTVFDGETKDLINNKYDIYADKFVRSIIYNNDAIEIGLLEGKFE